MIVSPKPESDKIKKRIKLGDLALDKQYLVFGVSINHHHNETMITIKSDDDDEPVAFDLNDFQIIDERIPSDWVFQSISTTSQWLLPKELSAGLWDLYYDGDREAEKSFAEVNNKLANFHSKPELMREYEALPKTAHDIIKEVEKYGKVQD